MNKLIRVLAISPILAFLSHHLLWLCAWGEFGKRPYPDCMRSPYDVVDPFTGFTAFFWEIPLLLLLSLPLITLFFFTYGSVNLFKRKGKWKNNLKIVLIFFALLTICTILLILDPGNIIYWYFSP